jgi:phenylacetate-CoA ligase
VSRADKLDQVEVHCELNASDAASADRAAIGAGCSTA